MEQLHTDEKHEALYQLLQESDPPRPFSPARIIVVKGAVGWFINLFVALTVLLLLLFSLSNRIGFSGASVFLSGVFILLLFLLIKRLAEPFHWYKLLKQGKLVDLKIVNSKAKMRVLSRIGSKHRVSYTLRFGEEDGDPELRIAFDGSSPYPGDRSIVLYDPESVIELEGKRVPKRVLALDCMLHHQSLTYPDLLENDRQEETRRALGYDDSWRSLLGSTAKALASRFAMALIIISAVCGALFYIFNMNG